MHVNNTLGEEDLCFNHLIRLMSIAKYKLPSDGSTKTRWKGGGGKKLRNKMYLRHPFCL